MRIALTTFGCKINQFETDALSNEFKAAGNDIVAFKDEADIYVINTCTITAKTDYQCRQAIKNAIRRNAKAKVVVTGCYAETRPEELKKIEGVDQVIGNKDKASLVHHILSVYKKSNSDPSLIPNFSVNTVRSRTRGLLKIQDGCNSRCSYCIVPFARGESRSIALQDVLTEFDKLVQNGNQEIVLTGIHIGMYGKDLTPKMELTDLLKLLQTRRGNARIRLSSIEPGEVTKELIGLLGNGFCRHLHIPLQSGDDSILQAMKRGYTAAFYCDLINGIANHVPGIALGADVMVGFPGEGEKEFKNTVNLIKELPITHLHVFSYSKRPGTLAAEMKNQITERIKKERNEILRNLGYQKNLAFRKIQQGNTLKIVVEDKVDRHTGLFTGLSDNYLRIHVQEAKKNDIGNVISVQFDKIEKFENFGEIM